MTEPRSLSFPADRWLTDSRVYNLIWMGRWLERAENVTRALHATANIAVGWPNPCWVPNSSGTRTSRRTWTRCTPIATSSLRSAPRSTAGSAPPRKGVSFDVGSTKANS